MARKALHSRDGLESRCLSIILAGAWTLRSSGRRLRNARVLRFVIDSLLEIVTNDFFGNVDDLLPLAAIPIRFHWGVTPENSESSSKPPPAP